MQDHTCEGEREDVSERDKTELPTSGSEPFGISTG